VESFSPGYLDSLGIGYSALNEINPSLIMTSITGFGQSGPYKDYKATELISFAMGAMFQCGEPAKPPSVSSIMMSLHCTAIHTAFIDWIGSHDALKEPVWENANFRPSKHRCDKPLHHRAYDEVHQIEREFEMGALSGLKVVEWSEFISGPYCGKLLADLGAEVIKVEKPCCGDKARSYGPFPQDIPHPEKSGLFLYLNTNKLGVTLNVGSVTGAHIFKELIKHADILIENHSPHEVEESGFDYETLKQLNPRLVMTSITPFGQTGPYRDYKACDLTSFHISGLAFMNPAGGVDDIEKEPPLRGKAYQGDFLAGLSGAIATMSAIFTCQATGLGQHIDLSEQEALASMIRRDLGAVTYEGFTRTRVKGAQPSAETLLGHCNDGQFFVVCNTDRFWKNWVEVMGNPDWAASELFQDRASRRENWDAAKIMIEEWAKEQTVDEIVRAAQAKRVPCTPVNTVRESANSDLLADRNYFVEVHHKEAGKFTYPGAPYKLSKTPWRVERPAPLLGEHNEEVFCGRLCNTRQDLIIMRAEGVI